MTTSKIAPHPGRRLTIATVTVELCPDGRVFWCDDWFALDRLTDDAATGVTRRHGGPDTYGHVDYYVR